MKITKENLKKMIEEEIAGLWPNAKYLNKDSRDLMPNQDGHERSHEDPSDIWSTTAEEDTPLGHITLASRVLEDVNLDDVPADPMSLDPGAINQEEVESSSVKTEVKIAIEALRNALLMYDQLGAGEDKRLNQKDLGASEIKYS